MPWPSPATRAAARILLVGALALAGCASAAPAPGGPPRARAYDDVRRVVIVASGESRFTVNEHSAEPGRAFDEIMKWNPSLAVLRPVAQLVHWGINWALELDLATDTSRHVEDLNPRSVVAGSLARALEASGWFDEVSVSEREPAGEARRRAEAIVRIAVPTWGVVRARAGDPDLVAGFADVRGRMTMRGTGVILWEDNEDVTGAEWMPIELFTRDRDFARQELVDVLERAGRRLASELLYARSAGR